MTTERRYERLDDTDAEHVARRSAAVIRAAELNGAHVWCVMTAFLIPDPEADGGAYLDRSNLMVYPAVGCFVCEEPYDPRLRLRRCPGEPR